MENELFYVGYREVFELPKRKGYTKIRFHAGKFSWEEAKNMTKHKCADGYGRWYISCSALDRFDGSMLFPKEVY